MARQNQIEGLGSEERTSSYIDFRVSTVRKYLKEPGDIRFECPLGYHEARMIAEKLTTAEKKRVQFRYTVDTWGNELK
jgi:hypothetical protein